jgi:class 3 adenylate cyclase/tetratricopeptide (TPR) repeat protein
LRCGSCGQDNPSSARFCQGCGARLNVSCAGCGAVLASDARFCAQCGRAVAGTTAPSATQVYTPKHLAERILTSRSALEGERKQVTVLFVDIVDSTQLAERLGPEKMHEVLDGILRLIADAVHRYEGTVNQFLGDGLMALFGAPVALEDHAVRGAYAAFAIQETVAGFSAQLSREPDTELQVRIGMNTGLVVVGKIGDDLRMDYTAVGDTTNLAARMQGAAAPGTIVVAEATHRLVEPYVRSEAIGPLSLKGIAGPVAAYRLTGRRRRTRLQASAERGLTALAGRKRELDLLDERFARVARGHGQVVGIVGEPGAGKSRLLHEFRCRIQPETAVVLEGRCVGWGQSTPYLPVAEVVRSSFQIEEGDNALQMEQKLRRGLDRLSPSLGETSHFLRGLVGLPLDEATAKLDARVRRQKTFEAIRAITMAASQRRPHVIVFEDLHWIDTTSEDYLAFVIESLAAMPVLIVTTSRPGQAARWADRAYFTQIALDLLDESEAEAMIANRLQTRALPSGLVSMVCEKAEGNPLFVEEILHALLDRGALVRRNGAVHWIADSAVEVPASGRDIIRARIDHLPDAVKRTLQTASVIGRQFTPLLLARVAEQAHELSAHLETLKRLELVFETRFFPEVEYAFRHALIQEVAYESLLERRRRELHARIGQALEDVGAGERFEQLDVLAHHFARSDQRAKAVDYLSRAADRAFAAFANKEAITRYDQALALAEGDDHARRAALLAKKAVALMRLPDAGASRRAAEEALALYQQSGDKPNTIAMRLHLNYLFTQHWDGAEEFRSREHLEAIVALVKDDPDSLEKALVYQRMAHLNLHAGRPAETLQWATKAVDMLARLRIPMGTSLGTALTYVGRIDEGVRYAESVWPGVLKGGNPLIVSIFGHDLVLTLALARHVAKAAEWGERVLPELVRLTEPGHYYEAFLRRPLTLAYMLAGDTERAEQCAQVVVEIERRTHFGCIYEDGAAAGLHRFRRGDWDGAQRALQAELAVHENRYTLTAVAGCSLGLGTVLLHTDTSRAEEYLRRALHISREGGNVLFELWVLPILAELHLRLEAHDQAAESVARGFELISAERNWYGLPGPMHLARGRLAQARGQRAAAEEDYRHAVEINRRWQLPWDEAQALEAWGRLPEAHALYARVGALRDAQRVKGALR